MKLEREHYNIEEKRELVQESMMREVRTCTFSLYMCVFLCMYVYVFVCMCVVCTWTHNVLGHHLKAPTPLPYPFHTGPQETEQVCGGGGEATSPS